MLDALSAPRIPVSDSAAPSSASASRSGNSEDGSFSKVMSSSGNQDRGERDGRESEIAEGNAEGADATVETADARNKRAMLDIRLTGTPAMEGTGLPADMSADDLAALLAAAKSKGKGVKGDAGEPEVDIAGLDPATRAQLAKAMAALRDKGSAKEAGETASDQLSTEDAADSRPGSLEDVLQLLTGGAGADLTGLQNARDAVETNKTAKDEKAEAVLDRIMGTAMGADDTATDASGDEQSDSDRAFRFVRSDGKGQSLLLRGESPMTPGDKAEQTQVETVTVIDTRRYLAPVSTSNAASITSAMLGDGEWLSAMSPGSELANAAAHSSQGKVVNTLKIQMSPIELGSVTATLRLSGEELSVQLTVENHAAHRALSNDQSDILKALRAQGLTVDQIQINVQVSSGDRSADAGQNGASGQQQGQQASQFTGQNGSERQARRETTDSTVRMTDERSVQQADVAVSDTRGTRPDLLYV